MYHILGLQTNTFTLIPINYLIDMGSLKKHFINFRAYFIIIIIYNQWLIFFLMYGFHVLHLCVSVHVIV